MHFAASPALTTALLCTLAGLAQAVPVNIPADVNISEINGAHGIRVLGASADDSCGSGVGAADVNGDGISDLIIGAKFADPDSSGGAGETYIIFGRKTLPGDPLLSTLDPTTLDGDNGFRITGLAGDFSGSAVANAGDVNGDKVDDVIIGAPYANGSGGAAYIVYGSKTTPFPASFSIGLLEGFNGFRAEDFIAGEYAGSAVAAGDINGDKLSDVIIGAPFANAGAGAVYVVFGRKTTSANDLPLLVDLAKLDGTFGFRVDGLAGGDRCGAGVAAVDINADKIADLVIGSPFADPNGDSAAGSTYVIFGHKATIANPFSASFNLAELDGSNGFRIDGINADDNSGMSVANAGDFNADKVPDLLIGAPGAELTPGSNDGFAYLFFGRKASNSSPYPATINLTTLNAQTGMRIFGSETDAFAGVAVSAAGDVNADKVADIIITSPGANNSAGETAVIFGRKPTIDNPLPSVLGLGELTGDNGFRINGITDDDRSGLAAAAAGDFNADKIGDFIIGAPASSTAGEAAVIFGPTSEAQVALEKVNIAVLSIPIVLDGGSVSLGDSYPGANILATFDIANLGLAELTVSRLKGPRGSSIQQPDAAVSPLTTATFEVLIPTPRVGNFTGKVSFSTNDPDEKKFDFTMTWSVSEPASALGPRPVIDVDSIIDLNNDWVTNATDIALMLRAIAEQDVASGDLNNDDGVNADDLVILLSGFTQDR